MKDFIYDLPTKVFFGKKQLEHLGEELSKYGKKVFLLYSSQRIKNNGIYDAIEKACKDYQLGLVEFSTVKPNPRHTDIQEATDLCKKEGCDVILAVGGGSTMDSAKLVATCALLDANVWDVVVKKVKANDSLPLIVIPTLAASGSEMNCGAVISNIEINSKQSFRIDSQRPKAAFMVPEITYSIPQYQTACGTIDILCHTLESYFSSHDCMDLMDNFMHGIVRNVMKYGPIAYNDPENYEARSNLMYAAPWAINEIVRADKELGWSVHPIEHELSAYYDITHGLGLAILLPRWLRHIIDEESLPRFVTLGIYGFDVDKNLSDKEIAEEVIKRIENLAFNTFHLASTLTEIGIDNTYFEEMANNLTNKTNGIFSNAYKQMPKEEIIQILNECL